MRQIGQVEITIYGEIEAKIEPWSYSGVEGKQLKELFEKYCKEGEAVLKEELYGRKFYLTIPKAELKKALEFLVGNGVIIRKIY